MDLFVLVGAVCILSFSLFIKLLFCVSEVFGILLYILSINSSQPVFDTTLKVSSSNSI